MTLLFSAAILLGATLLFLVEPMVAKMLLPGFGGAPAVWNTCMLFFQAALLAGYGYVHATSRWLGTRLQAAVQAVVVLLPLAFLPIGVPAGAGLPADGSSPVPNLLGTLVRAVGLPFLVVATAGPLFQGWFASTGHRRAADPYFLYVSSNAGSLLGLVGYVGLIEPNLPLPAQSRLWAGGYAAFAVLSLACVAVALARGRPASRPAGGAGVERAGPLAGRRTRWTWVALALAPSSLMLGVTTYLSTEVAPMPLLWAAPLALYLLSLMLAFASSMEWARRALTAAFPVVVAAEAGLLVVPAGDRPHLGFALHLAAYFAIASACHVRLARLRPPAGELTGYYLWIALGGALGGAFNALLAPRIFDRPAELAIALALAAGLVPSWGRGRAGGRLGPAADVLLPLAVGGLAYLALGSGAGAPRALRASIPCALCLGLATSPRRFGLGVGAVLVAAMLHEDAEGRVAHRARNFFGTLTVKLDHPEGVNSLTHGHTIHGAQRRGPTPAARRVPLLYYYPTGSIGQVFLAHDGDRRLERVAVVGLGIGALASYAEPGREIRFYEIDPAIARVATDRRFFTHLADCEGSWSIALGDARKSLEREPGRRFGLLVVDAFTGDAIPVHLLTREALRLYADRLEDLGLIAVHISNRYVDLEPVLAATAREAGLVGLVRRETLAEIDREEFLRGRIPTDWVVLARDRRALRRLARLPGWRPLAGRRGVGAWTDDFSSLIGVLQR